MSHFISYDHILYPFVNEVSTLLTKTSQSLNNYVVEE